VSAAVSSAHLTLSTPQAVVASAAASSSASAVVATPTTHPNRPADAATRGAADVLFPYGWLLTWVFGGTQEGSVYGGSRGAAAGGIGGVLIGLLTLAWARRHSRRY